MNYGKLSLLALLCWVALSCARDQDLPDLTKSKEARQIIWHNNIVIVPDLSNRNNQDLYPRQLDDKVILRTIVEHFPSMLSTGNRLVSQKDKLTLRPLNPRDVDNYNSLAGDLTIDLGTFKINHSQRKAYIKNTGETTLKGDQERFLAAASTFYEGSEKGYTADLYGFFNQTLKANYFNLTAPLKNRNAVDTSRNILIVLTDGYIERGDQTRSSCPDKQCRLLNTYQIKAFRRDCNCSQDPGKTASFFAESGYGIIPVQNENLKDVEVLMLEVYDRSKTASGRNTVYPSDYEVMELFWTDFFERSGAKRFRMVETAAMEAAIRTEIEDFLAEQPEQGRRLITSAE